MMKKNILLVLLFACFLCIGAKSKRKVQPQLFPDGSVIPAWFSDTVRVDVSDLGKKYVITEYGVKQDSTIVQTEAIQQVIDQAAAEGGGVVVVPEGTFQSGSLFFRQGTHLFVEQGGKLKGSDRIRDFKLLTTRIEGQTCTYFAALVNADGIDGFTMAGKGTIDGNGHDYWEEFWIRRQWNKDCTNKDAQRPRLVYISNSRNVTVQDLRLVNSPFWTNHVYKCSFVRYLNCFIYAPTEGILAPEYKKGAPSSDAIDIDACHDVLIHGCFMHVNDDAVVLKGGKGTWADKDSTNGPCQNIIIEKCTYGCVHGCLTLGSESLHDRNVILRDCLVEKASRVLWLKMRPDTPQHYEYVTVERLRGKTGSFLVVRPWTQFFAPEKRDDMPLSLCNNILMRQIRMDCVSFFDVGQSDRYKLKDFTYEDIDVTDQSGFFDQTLVEGCTVRNLIINGKLVAP